MTEKLTEADIETKCIEPALNRAGWDVTSSLVHKQFPITKGRIIAKARFFTPDELAALNYDKAVSLKLTAEFGAGFTTTNLRYMRLVYQAFPICHTLCDKLSWSHDRLLATVEELQRELQKERTAVEEALRLQGQTTLNLPIRKKGAK